MARRTHQPITLNVEPAPVPENHALAQIETELRQITENTVKLADRIGYDGPLTLGGAEEHARMQMRRTVSECLELGKALLIIKELTPQGGYRDRIELLGIDVRTAQRFMQATLKFSKAAAPTLLAAAGNQSKLLELLVLDDDEIKELSENGSTRGIELDDIARMSQKELRSALREEREEKGHDLSAKDKYIATQAETIQKLHKDLAKSRHRLESATPDQVGADLCQETSGIGWGIVGQINVGLARAFGALDEHARANDCTHDEFMSGVLFEIERALLAIREDYAVKARPDGDARPDWTRPDFDWNAPLSDDMREAAARFEAEHGYNPMGRAA